MKVLNFDLYERVTVVCHLLSVVSKLLHMIKWGEVFALKALWTPLRIRATFFLTQQLNGTVGTEVGRGNLLRRYSAGLRQPRKKAGRRWVLS